LKKNRKKGGRKCVIKQMIGGTRKGRRKPIKRKTKGIKEYMNQKEKKVCEGR
jgi:hypothetical protein